VPSQFEPVIPAGRLGGRPQAVVDGYGLRLRPWDETDVHALLAAYADPGIVQWHARTVLDAAEARAWLDERARSLRSETGVDWAVVHPADESVVLGRAGLNRVDLTEGLAEIAYWVLPEHRGRNIAARATCALADWSFDELGLHRLGLEHSTQNQASCAVAERAGLVYEGTLREAALHPDGWHDMHLHARLAGDPRPVLRRPDPA
jgi:[ribosomal protein S5]-alanine N-acetyltransferase